MAQDKLTTDEISLLNRSYPRKQFLTIKEGIFFFLASFTISAPFCILFLLTSRFMHNDNWGNAFSAGAYALPIGPALFLIFAFTLILSGWRSDLKGIRKEIKIGNCDVVVYKVIRAWPLIDQGNFDAPELLVQIPNSRFLAIPMMTPEVCSTPRNRLELRCLPISRIPVGVNFTGKEIALDGEIVTKNVWRHDNLPYLETINRQYLPSEVLETIG